jgi:hypothetical protein
VGNMGTTLSSVGGTTRRRALSITSHNGSGRTQHSSESLD